ncbi:MAG: glycosyl hydrolase [Bacteroidetes bacterium]|nr:MAG: glycosyl hydrolase [Bacteroidota bacterium]
MLTKLIQFCCFVSVLVLSLTTYSQPAPTSGEERLKTIQQRKTLEQNSLVNNVKFRNIGPVTMSGRVVDIEANPEDPTEFYAAYASGGLWHTTNNGQSFNPIFDSEDILTIGDIAVDWKNKTIWIGTGEVNSSRSSYAGIGVYKSSDNGKTWSYQGLPESHHIGKILLHPTDPNTIWVAALGHLYSPNKDRGVYKTTDGGKTWKQTLFVDDNTGAVEMDINPSNPKEVYAAVWYKTRRAWQFEESGKTSGIYKSNDGGDTWQFVSGPGSGFMTGEKIGRIGLCVFPKNPNIVYAIVDNNNPKPDTTQKKADSSYKKEFFKSITKEQFLALETRWIDTFLRKNFFPAKYTGAGVKELVKTDKVPPTALYDYLDSDDGFQNTGIYGCEVYRSDDAGKTWKKTHDKAIPTFNTYGYYFAKIYTSSTNPENVYILGFNAMYSKDGGKNFVSIDKSGVHADHHALWVNPKRDGHIINGNDGGINLSYDYGEHWFKANSIPVGQFYGITTDNARPYNVYGGLQDNGVWVFPSQSPRNPFAGSGLGQTVTAETSIGGGDGMQVQVDPRDNVTTYSGSQFGSYARTNRVTRENTKRITPRHELGDKPLRFNWQTPIWLSQHNPDVLYYGANRFYRSLNKADTLLPMTPDLTNGRKPGNVPYGTLTTIHESPLQFGLVYTGSDDGNIHITKDGGYNWEQINQTVITTQPSSKTKVKTITGKPQTSLKLQTNNLWVSRVTASGHKNSRVYVSLNGYRFDNFAPYLYVSEDYGQSWTTIGKDLPNEPINVIKEDPKYDSILYVGTDGGLYVSIDKGNNFMLWNAGMPKSVPVHDITIQQRDNEIVIGTHGRSIYIAKLDDVQKLLKDPEYRVKMAKEKDLKTKVDSKGNDIN